MRWLLALVIVDVAAVVMLIGGAGATERADLVFACSSEHTFLDPQRISWSHDIRVAENLFEPLLRVELPSLRFGPATAQSWELSDDGLTYTFHIRPNARWSNGDPVNASDFIYAWRRALLPDFASDYSYMLWHIDGAEDFFNWRQKQLTDYAANEPNKTVEAAQRLLDEALDRFKKTVAVTAPDDKTLKVRLARPVPYFDQICAFITLAPVHEKSVAPQASLDPVSGRLVQDAQWTRPDRLVTNGPYMLKRRRFKRDLLMVANPYYWNRQAMQNDSILELIVPDTQMQLLLYEDGQVDWLPDIPSSSVQAADLVKDARAGKRTDVHVPTAAGTYYYCFNCQPTLPEGRANPLHDPRVRKAFSMAIDRKTIVEKVTRMNQPIALTFVPPGALPDYTPPTEAGVSFDPDEALRLLAEAGYPEGKGLEGLTLLYNTSGGHEVVAQQIRHNWEKYLHVNVRMEGKETAVFIDDRRQQNFAIARHGWLGDYLDPTTFLDLFQSANGNNDGRYSNPKYDALLEEAANELNRDKRMALLRQAETLMLQDAGAAPIYHYVWFHLFDPDRVQNMYLNPWNYRRLEFVKVAKSGK